jgi:iron complex outermembrane receptor protein
VNQDLNTFDRVNTGGISLTVNQDAGFMNIVDIASYRSTLVNYPFDDDVTSVPAADVILDEHAHNISKELQLVSKDNGWLKWLLDAYYYKGTGAYPEVFIDGGLQVEDKQITESESGFGQATATFFDTNFTAGVRYTSETQDFSVSEPVQFVKSQGVDRITYRLAVDRQLAEDVMACFSYNRGFKSGGFNLLDPGNIFKPEILDATEIGIKSELFNKRVRLNLDAFYYNYQDIQLFVGVFGGSIVKNSAGAHTKGVEGDLTVVPIDNLTLNASMAYLDGRYTDDPGAAAITANGVTLPAVNDAGKHTPNTPPFTGAFNASYEIDTPYGSFRPAGSVVYNNGYYWQPDNRLVQPAYTLINASLLWTSTSGKYSAQLWGKNLAQATYYIARISAAGIGDAQEQAPPRTIGLTLKVRF